LNRALQLFVAFFVLAGPMSGAQVSTSPQPTTPDAQVRLGNQYLSQHDYSAALTWYRKAADQGNATAQAKVGWLYENGFGVKQDYAEALNWYRKAADQGNAAAQNNIGWFYQNGFGVKQDYGVAVDCFRRAADQGNTKAEVNLGLLYENGTGVARDYAEALRLYLAAANQGDAVAQNNTGVLYEKGLGVEKDYRVAMAWYYRAADQGSALAQDNLGLLYRNGLGVPQDYGKAASWFRKAAEGGNAKAQVSLAWLYANGLGVGLDHSEAMAWYRKAADQGYADGQNGIGWLYENGFGVKKDYAEAMNWYQKSADQNDADAENHIGWFYQNGWGVKQDYAEAMSWYQKAAAQGHVRAKANIELLSKIESQSAPGTSQKDGASSGKSGAVFMVGGIKAPHSIYSPDPEYSEEARKKAISGTALLSLIVGSDGQPRDIKVVAPLGNGLDEKAVETVKTWKFEPATKDGNPVAVQIMVEVSFHLYEKSSIGQVQVVNDTQGESFDSYLSPMILKASECWRKSTEETAHTPSAKQGQLRVQMRIERGGRVADAEIVSPSGDSVLDQDARECVGSLKMDGALLPEFRGKELVVRMQFLYNTSAMSINPIHPQVAAGSEEQFYVDMAGTLGATAKWSVSGVGCNADACGTITADGVYDAPDVLPQPPFVVVNGTLAGANPITASAIVTLTAKPTTNSAKSQ